MIRKVFATIIFSGIIPFSFCGPAIKHNNLHPVEKFELSKYLGTWYEIGRFDHSFERGLEEVTAEYTMRKDGKVRVFNSGQREKAANRKSNEGYAEFTGKSDIGELRVTFFWPFSGLYRIAELGEKYEYAVVVGSDFNYLWILSRTPKMEQKKLDAILENIKKWGFNLSKIRWVKQKV